MALPPRKHRRKPFPEPAKERAVPEAVPEPELLPRQAPVKFRHEREKDEQAQKDQEFLDNWRGEETAIVPTPILLRFQVFVGHYLCCLNAAEAARRTGFYKHPARSGADLLRHPEVQKLLYEQQRSLLAKIGVTAERIWAEYARIAFLDPAEAFDENGEFKPIPDIPEEIRRAITSYKVKRMSFGEDGESVEIGYWLLAEHEGRGVATRAVIAATDWAMQAIAPSRIYAQARAANVASCRVLEKAGFAEIKPRDEYRQFELRAPRRQPGDA